MEEKKKGAFGRLLAFVLRAFPLQKVVFGGVLAYALLLLLEFAIILALNKASQCPETGTCPPLRDGIAQILETVGALVSAVVISELSVTKPSHAPGEHIADLFPDDAQKQKDTVKVLASLYIALWLLAGLALVFGWMWYPTVPPELSSAARRWLGVAIAAAYCRSRKFDLRDTPRRAARFSDRAHWQY